MDYSNDSIKALKLRDHIRLRPAMYIGSTDGLGTHNMLIGFLRMLCSENTPNSEIRLTLEKDRTIINFKGTFLHKILELKPEQGLKELTELGDNFNNEHYLAPALFHLTSFIEFKGPSGTMIGMEDGKFSYSPAKIGHEDLLSLSFELDSEIFENLEFSRSVIAFECEKLAALCSNVSIELLDHRNGSEYQERFVMNGGLIQLFKSNLDRIDSERYESYGYGRKSKIFHIAIEDPKLFLELAFSPSHNAKTFERSYYRFLNLSDGGSHVSYFKKRIKQLNKKLGSKDQLKYVNVITNIETQDPFPFLGPTKTRIEDPQLVQIMKRALDKIEPEVIAFFSSEGKTNN